MPEKTYRWWCGRPNGKEKQLIDILRKVQGSAIVYVRSRKSTANIAKLLHRNQISSTYYHAGLSYEDRVQRQREWIENQVRVIVATNAFGMGINKADVRTVVHLDIPETLEAYYQEAGRAGRDGKEVMPWWSFMKLMRWRCETKQYNRSPH